MANSTTTRRAPAPIAKEAAPAFGASGTIVGKVKSVEFKQFAGKETAFVHLLCDGAEVRAYTYREEVMQVLDTVQEGDELNVFGFCSSRFDGRDSAKVWSDFRIYSVTPAKGSTQVSKFSIFGKFIQVCKVGTGVVLDVDITTKEEFPTFIRLRVPDDLEIPPVEEDEIIKCFACPAGKLGTMTVYAFVDPNAADEDSEPPVGLAKLNRFRRNSEETSEKRSARSRR